MVRVTARVRGGRLVVDEPTDLPEGTKVELMEADESDGLDDEDRERLHAALEASEADVRAGRLAPVDEILAHLRRSDVSVPE